MRLNVKAFAIASSLLWGGGVFFIVLLNRFRLGYGLLFLKSLASVYPIYQGGIGLKDGLVGVVCALIDGAVGGSVLAWFYNHLAAK